MQKAGAGLLCERGITAGRRLGTVLVCVLLGTAGCATGPPAMVAPGPGILEDVRVAMQDALDALGADLERAAAALQGLDPTDAQAAAILRELCEGQQPHAVDCASVDRGGIMVAVEPGKYSEAAGADISGQEQIERLHATQAPVMSGLFLAVEGFHAVDVEYPVLDSGGEFAGSVSLLMQHEAFIRNALGGILKGNPHELWVSQVDGTVLYNPDRMEIGRNVLRDSLYQGSESLLRFTREMVREEKGSGRYRYFRTGFTDLIWKDAWWTTVSLYGTEWRLILMRERG